MKKRGKIFSKRGLSEVITSVIMVLLVLVAIAIVWVVVKNALDSGTDQLSISRITIGLKIKNVVVDNVSNNVSITLKREVGEGDVSGIKFVVTDGINSQIFQDDSQLRELEEKKFTFTVNNQTIFVDNITQVSVVPILTTSSGKALSGMTYNYDVQEGTITTTSSQQEGTPPSCINDDSDNDGYNKTNGCGPIDCNDLDPLINPGATEICNNIDDNCVGGIDEGIPLIIYYRDFDGDAYGNLSNTQQSCSQPFGYVTNNTDCNDNNTNIKPGATEVCDIIDNDCDGQIDEEINCANLIGFLGCSVSHNAVEGYADVGGTKFWPADFGPNLTYSGGALSTWYTQLITPPGAKERDYWEIFTNLSIRYQSTTKVIWWELCSSNKTKDISYENVTLVLNKIKEISPNTEIYATPMPIFPNTTSGICVENNGPAIIRNFTDRMISEGKVKAGPILTNLTQEYGNPPNEEACHANDAGQVIWGNNLKDFFG